MKNSINKQKLLQFYGSNISDGEISLLIDHIGNGLRNDLKKYNNETFFDDELEIKIINNRMFFEIKNYSRSK